MTAVLSFWAGLAVGILSTMAGSAGVIVWSDHMTDEQRDEVDDWVVRTVELFGATRATAYLVAGTFMRGLDREAQLDEPNVS